MFNELNIKVKCTKLSCWKRGVHGRRGDLFNWFLMLLINFLSLNGFAQVDEVKQIGDQAYLNGSIDSAITTYESILAQEYESAEVYFNLGNAYYKSKDIANTILNYERALKLAPNDEDIQFNLRLANLRTVDKIEAVPEFKLFSIMRKSYQLLPMDSWAWLGFSLASWSSYTSNPLIRFSRNSVFSRQSWPLSALPLSFIRLRPPTLRCITIPGQ